MFICMENRSKSTTGWVRLYQSTEYVVVAGIGNFAPDAGELQGSEA